MNLSIIATLASALVAAMAAISIAVMNQRNSQNIQRLQQEHEIRMATAQKDHEQQIQTLRHASDAARRQSDLAFADIAKYNDSRAKSLNRLWNAMSMANSAAQSMVQDTDTRNAAALVERTSKFFQQSSLYLTEAAAAPTDLSLRQEDIDLLGDATNCLIKLFLCLDLDAGDKEEYQDKLDAGKSQLDKAVRAFEDHARRCLVPK